MKDLVIGQVAKKFNDINYKPGFNINSGFIFFIKIYSFFEVIKIWIY